MATEWSRRGFLTSAGAGVLAAGTLPSTLMGQAQATGKKRRIALVGTGIRGTTFWGRNLAQKYSDLLEFVGLCDINPGRVAFAKGYIGVDCPTFTDFEQMVATTKPDLVIVTTMDSTHHEFIIKALQMGCDVLTEKPLTTDEDRCQGILDAEAKSRKKIIVGFNYRWNPYMTRIKELLQEGAIGEVVSVDFHWMLNTYHGASYFRRWHGLRQCSGTLLVHKATHHFDLVNWWLDSEPQEVFAYGDLENYGSNGKIRGENCRKCPHKEQCEYFWDITRDKMSMDLYANNEQYDGYYRDNCLFRHEINIYDKMSAQIKYANNAVVNYSLTTYSPYEGWKIAFNGTKGRLEAWLDIPFLDERGLDQEAMHAIEMSGEGGEKGQVQPIIVHNLWNKQYKTVGVSTTAGGHGGGDQGLQDRLFRNPEAPDPYNHTAGVRDGAMSILVGVAVRKSIESGRPIRIEELTTLVPRAQQVHG